MSAQFHKIQFSRGGRNLNLSKPSLKAVLGDFSPSDAALFVLLSSPLPHTWQKLTLSLGCKDKRSWDGEVGGSVWLF